MDYGSYDTAMNDSLAWGLLGTYWLVWLAVLVFQAAVMWRLFEKAERPGWAALIPIYNAWVYCEICGKPGWWMLAMFVPLLNVVIAILLAFLLAERFGHGIGFGIGLVLLSLIFHAILAFGDSRWTPPSEMTGTMMRPAGPGNPPPPSV
jgi:uncharacterized membrane protein YhaH (DUF805 family)